MKTKAQRKIFNCPECGIEVSKLECQLKPGQTNVYCSRACLGASKRNGSELLCKQCSNTFYRRYGEQDLGTRVNQFCSRTCYMGWRSEHLKPSTYKKLGSRHEHRLVAESMLGRELKMGEVVHHIDGNQHNNHHQNIAVLPSQSIHAWIHFKNVAESEWEQYRVTQ